MNYKKEKNIEYETIILNQTIKTIGVHKIFSACRDGLKDDY
ncbi:MAG: hypothetical protein U0W24_07650 [Bacteroidales bacterium]